MRVAVTVTAEDAAKGRRCHAEACPVALAMERAGLRMVSVSGIDVCANGSIWITPRWVQDFVRAFDQHGAAGVAGMVPMTFSLTGVRP